MQNLGWIASRRGVLVSLALLTPSFAADLAISPRPPGAASGHNPSAAPAVGEGLSVPVFNSDPGAAYTIYLDFGGFSFNGNWGNNAAYTPGVTPAYDSDGNAAAFSAAELTNIHTIWSRVAQRYAAFNVNITTVDPAVAAGQAGSDTARQNYYDATAHLMHTVVGGTDTWVSAGGISYIGVTPGAFSGSNGYHTNFVFSLESPTDFNFVSDGISHENGHGFGLNHQSDYNGTTLVSEYSYGNNNTAHVAPIMGYTYPTNNSTLRGLWSQGTADAGSPVIQNDPQVIANDNGMGGYRQDGIGHTRTTASRLPQIFGTNAIDYTKTQGIIVPASLSNPNPIGSANYTADHWSFVTTGGTVTLKVNSGIATFGTAAPDSSPTLDATLALYDSTGNLLQLLDTTSLSEVLTTTLGKGTYDLAVLSHGGETDSASNNRGFYDIGSYFVSGSIPTPIVGDTDLNGHVDIGDLGLLAQNWQKTGVGWVGGDYDGNGIVDIGDLGMLAQHWQYGVTGNGLDFADALAQVQQEFNVAVPEPATTSLLMAGGLMIFQRRKRA